MRYKLSFIIITLFQWVSLYVTLLYEHFCSQKIQIWARSYGTQDLITTCTVGEIKTRTNKKQCCKITVVELGLYKRSQFEEMGYAGNRWTHIKKLISVLWSFDIAVHHDPCFLRAWQHPWNQMQHSLPDAQCDWDGISLEFYTSQIHTLFG